MLEAKSLSKAVVPSSLIKNPSPGSLQSTRLALHVAEDCSSCWVYIASGCQIYKLLIPLEESLVGEGKEGLLIPVLREVLDSFMVNRCPHRSEIQSMVLSETESNDYSMLGTVDSYGHLIVSKLDTTGEGKMLEAKSLSKAVVPSSLIKNPSPGSLQSTRLALHVAEDCSSCWVYIASGCQIYKLLIPLEESLVGEGKEGLLIPVLREVMDSFMVNRCPHRSEIQSMVLSETESNDYSMLGTVDSYGHLIVSKLDTTGEERLTYSVLPRDCGIGESGWAGLSFSPAQWSTAAVARSFCKTIDVYDQDIHVRTLCT
ncbi:hypothetical protein C1H46_018838 [Malus baccata]|uniref:Nucleoporin Nup133/Nup155-like N-terminal domain-containing protein n=1 Tax=Malus baccata TaxID=106549 RepID=A0A540M9X2_MALBA|nr:hypothetical protein C1H46_018838 [Malus baccata]